jgi:hypothetical protein
MRHFVKPLPTLVKLDLSSSLSSLDCAHRVFLHVCKVTVWSLSEKHFPVLQILRKKESTSDKKCEMCIRHDNDNDRSPKTRAYLFGLDEFVFQSSKRTRLVLLFLFKLFSGIDSGRNLSL